MRSQFEDFNEEARRALQISNREAQRLNHNYIGDEHILLALVQEIEDVAARVLTNLGVDLTRVRSAVDFITDRRNKEPVQVQLGFSLRVKKVIDLAIDEARRMNHAYVGSEHLLIALLRVNEGIAVGILEVLGVTLEKARTETLRVLPRVDT